MENNEKQTETKRYTKYLKRINKAANFCLVGFAATFVLIGSSVFYMHKQVDKETTDKYQPHVVTTLSLGTVSYAATTAGFVGAMKHSNKKYDEELDQEHGLEK